MTFEARVDRRRRRSGSRSTASAPPIAPVIRRRGARRHRDRDGAAVARPPRPVTSTRPEPSCSSTASSIDDVTLRFGCREFDVDPDLGFVLNGEPYPLRGVSRHQDWEGVGNAITHEMMETDLRLVQELGATSVRLAHYQHDQYFYDLCDEAGIVVWAEIPQITSFLPNATGNATDQLTELIVQNRHHASIVCWGLSNEITLTGSGPEVVAAHRELNDLAHRLDPTRLTAMAHLFMLETDHPLVTLPDVLAYNLYYGWYVGELSDNDEWLDKFRRRTSGRRGRALRVRRRRQPPAADQHAEPQRLHRAVPVRVPRPPPRHDRGASVAVVHLHVEPGRLRRRRSRRGWHPGAEPEGTRHVRSLGEEGRVLRLQGGMVVRALRAPGRPPLRRPHRGDHRRHRVLEPGRGLALVRRRTRRHGRRATGLPIPRYRSAASTDSRRGAATSRTASSSAGSRPPIPTTSCLGTP